MSDSHKHKRTAVGIFGKQGTGKSALEVQLLNEYLKGGGKVIAYDRAGHFGKHSQWEGSHGAPGWLERVVLGKHRGLLILDDADIYMNSRSGATMRDMFASFRHYDLDLLVSARMPQGIDVTLLACLDRLCLFKMTSPHGRRHVENLLGGDFPGILDHIPKENYQYLDVDMNKGTAVLRKTVQIRG